MRGGSAPTKGSPGPSRSDPPSSPLPSETASSSCPSSGSSRTPERERSQRSAGKRQGGGRPHRQSQAAERLSHAHQGAAQVAGGTSVGGASIGRVVRDAGRGEGQHLHARVHYELRLQDPRGLSLAVRGDRRGKAESGGRADRREDEL